jgi:hypothetical protein
MTDEELETLIQEVSEQVKKLPEEREKPLSKEERKQKTMLQLEGEILQKIKTAREKGSLNQEIRACVDYSLLKQYGKKNFFLMNFFKSQMTWFGW